MRYKFPKVRPKVRQNLTLHGASIPYDPILIGKWKVKNGKLINGNLRETYNRKFALYTISFAVILIFSNI